MAYDDGGDAEAGDQHIAHEILRLEARKRAVKRLDDEMVQTGFSEGRGPLVQGLDEREPASSPKQDLARVRIKGQHDGFCPFLSGLVHHPVEEGAVAEVDTVKGSCGRDATLAGRKVGKSSVDAHCR